MSATSGTFTFTEKDFYLAEFRGRTIGVALPPDPPPELAPLDDVIGDLTANDVRVVIFCATDEGIAGTTGPAIDPAEDGAWSGALWRRLCTDRRAAVVLGRDGFAERCRDAVVRLRLAKLVWLDANGSLLDGAGKRISNLALPDLTRRADELARASDAATVPLDAIRAMLEAGVSSVSVCSLPRLAEELFTYAGSGTFFTRERYADVRRLSLDDFDAAARLLEQGVAEGYLAPRSKAEIDAILSHGFGVFIEGRYLAGIGALRPYPAARQGEIAGLYTLTRFAGEGVGGHLVRFALDSARSAGLGRVFACTTSERVAGFFARMGFESVDGESLPEEKWAAYPEDRRGRLKCVAFALD